MATCTLFIIFLFIYSDENAENATPSKSSRKDGIFEDSEMPKKKQKTCEISVQTDPIQRCNACSAELGKLCSLFY